MLCSNLMTMHEGIMPQLKELEQLKLNRVQKLLLRVNLPQKDTRTSVEC